MRQFVTGGAHRAREPEVSFREGWENLAFIRSAYDSLDGGKPVELPKFDDIR